MILITGGMGFLGISLGRYLAEQGEEVLLTQRRPSSIPLILSEFINRQVKIVNCDILDLPSIIEVIKKHRVDSVIHSAVITQAKGSLYQLMRTNIEGLVNVLEAARLTEIKRVSYVSSGTLYYEIESKEPYKETLPLYVFSKTEVSASKKVGEVWALFYASQYGMDIRITRPPRIYGPYYSTGRNPMMFMVENAVTGKPTSLPQVHEQMEGDFIYIRDCARGVGMVHLATKPRHNTYNVGSGRNHSFGDIAQAIKKVIPKCKIELGRGERAPSNPACLDITRMKEEFGYWPEYDLDRGIREYIEWIRKGKP